MSYEIVVDSKVEGSTLTGILTITEDGKPFGDGVWNFRNIAAKDIAEKQADMNKYVSKSGPLTGLNYKAMHNFERGFAKLVLSWGDKHKKNK